jgi:hypothetical protein
MNFKNYKRFFAFGCSFTQYHWPTWADIIGQEFSTYYNYGKCGAGNFFIFQSLTEAIVKHNINKDDLVMVMFSNVTREDRFVKKRGWVTPGNLYFQDEYDKKFLEKYLCDHGYLMRDLNLITGCKLALDAVGCDYKLMSMIPFDSKQSDSKKMSNVDYLLTFYEKVLTTIQPSVFDVVFDGDWNTRQPRPAYKVSWSKELFVDNHPTPNEHLEYLQKVFPDIVLSDKTLEYVANSNSIALSKDFSMNTYITDLTPRLGENYTNADHQWVTFDHRIKKRYE